MGRIVDELLAKRGLSGAAADEYLDPSVRRLVKAAELPGMSDAVECILPFVRDRRRIVIFGDYDCDGVCASAILSKTLARLGANSTAFVPDRFSEGYGLTPQSVDRLLREHPDVALVVTVDCGVTSAAEVKTLKERGVAVVVTDHHLPPDELPECDALVDMKAVAAHRIPVPDGAADLCGAGVAFFLANALAVRAAELGMYGGGKFGGPLLVLAGLATVVDIVPLLGQNRILAANALQMFRGSAVVGLSELLQRAQRRPVALTARDFGFLIGPRINAAGRMATARTAYDLLMTEDREEARRLAHDVDVHNVERKTIEAAMLNDAVSQVEASRPSAVVVANERSDGPVKWHSGVSGNVASRLVEKYRVPVAVVVDGRGSVRAPDGYNVHSALTACSEFLLRFGGHVAAGGFTVKDGMLDGFMRGFAAACAAQADGLKVAQDGAVLDEPDIWVDPADLTVELHGELQKMAPFGEGNPEPVFGLRGVVFSDIKPFGESGRHISFMFSDRRIPRAVWWGRGDIAESLRAKAVESFDVTFTLEVSDWGGEEPHPELRVTSLAPSRGAASASPPAA